jgi:hypothetical protein
VISFQKTILLLEPEKNLPEATPGEYDEFPPCGLLFGQ